MTTRKHTPSEETRAVARAYARQLYATSEIVREKKRAYHLANREQRCEAMRKHRDANPDKHRRRHKAYRVAHYETLLAKDRAYYATHREEILHKLRQRRAENPAPSLAAKKKWEAKHPEKRKEYKQKYETTSRGNQVRREIKARRLAKERGATINNLSAAQWQEIQAAYNYRCVYCPDSCWCCQHKKHALTRDHIDPVVKGGHHAFYNIVPACQKHNSQKHDGPVLNPIQPLLLTIAPSRKQKKGA